MRKHDSGITNITGANHRSAKCAVPNKITVNTGIINPYSAARDRIPACMLFFREPREKKGAKKMTNDRKNRSRPAYGESTVKRISVGGYMKSSHACAFR